MRMIGFPIYALPLFLSHPACAQSSAEAHALVVLVSPADLSASKVAELLFNPAAGALTISIPGGVGGSTSMNMTVSGLDSSTGAFVFSISQAALTQLLDALRAPATGATLSGTLANGLSLGGPINRLGVQVVLMATAKNPDGGAQVAAIITFD